MTKLSGSDHRAQLYLQDLDTGLTYREVGDRHGVSADAVRNVIRRYNQRTTGSYRGYFQSSRSKDLHDELVPITEQSGYYTTSKEPELEVEESNLEIWNIDIERLPRVEYAWSAKRYDTFTPERMLISDSRMVSFAAKKLRGPTVFASEHHHGRENMLKTLWHILDRATIVVGFNSRRFDVPHMDGELRDSGFPTYRPFKQIDLLQSIKSRFNYDYKNLSSIARRWGLEEEKMDTGGFDLWKRCFNGDPEAWDLMREYNIQDVKTCEEAYLDNLPWLTGSIPNLGLYADWEFACPACGSSKVEPDGTASTGVSLYRAYRCEDCGYRSRSNEKVSSANLRPITR